MHKYELDGILLTTHKILDTLLDMISILGESYTSLVCYCAIIRKPIAIVPEIGESEFKKTWLDEIKTWPSPRPEDEGLVY